MIIFPLSALIILPIAFKTVDLPQPLAPIIDVILPFLISILKSGMTTKSS